MDTPGGFWSFALLLLVVGLCKSESFEETLYMKRLPSGHVYTHFEFVIRDKSLSNDTRLFPRSLGEILEAHDIQELQFSLTQGYWRIETWGEPIIPAPTGGHVVAWFTAADQASADKNWNGFTSRLSGLTCASLNFLDVKTSIEPKFAYRPLGVVKGSGSQKPYVRVGNLPRENVCTENLTPWSKLLPCGVSRGLSSLLRSKQLFNTHYHSEGIYVTHTEDEIITKLTISLVFDPPTKLKDSDNLPKRVLGSLAIFPCHPATKSEVLVWNGKGWEKLGTEINYMRVADLPSVEGPPDLVFTALKYMGGYGQEYGTMIVEMTNHLVDKELSVLYVEVLPWYIRPYLHTMTIDVQPRGTKLPNPPGLLFHYTPGRDREVLHKLEMDMKIPPKSTIRISFTVEKGHLKWNEYPPDANHGFYLEAAHFEVNVTGEEKPRNYYSRVLLVNLSTPDFSMPYNVICLTCTVVALAFGPIHNITTKQLKLSVYSSKSEKLKGLGKKLWQKLRRKKPEDEDTSKSEERSQEKDQSIETESSK